MTHTNTSVVPAEKEPRHPLVRALWGILWVVPIHLAAILVASIAASALTSTPDIPTIQEGIAAGRRASSVFVKENKATIFLISAAITATLTYLGQLPGTAPFKRVK